MGDATTLFDLPGFRVASVELTPLNLRRVIVMQVADEHGCPQCGVLVGGKPYDVREMRVKDLPVGHRPLLVVWRKRRYRCLQSRCPQRVFTERSEQIPPRHRLTQRLRDRLEQAASRSARALSDVAAEYGCRGGACTMRCWSRPSTGLQRCRRCGCSAWTRPAPGRCAGAGTGSVGS